MTLKAFELLEKKGFEKADGSWYELTSSIDKEEGLFLNKLISENKPNRSLEIGCAEGISSMVICESIGPDGDHTILDPFQSTEWQNHGVNNLKKAGFNNFTIFEERSEFALPRLASEGNKYDFVFVDGWHTFDHVLVEFFYINKMLNVGGVVAFDDAALTGLNRLMRFISNYPNYEIIGSVSDKYVSGQRKMLNVMKRTVNALFSPLGTRLKQELLNDTVVRSDSALKIDGNVTAFKKTAEDDRGWAWYKPF
ncbi:MAG: class I SAM-dependent methyltransferase [Chitinophagales bacterium]|nr:class I SAM-dependent methyltransferase [Chitinophagaceae bacterium]MCB9066015.1 class I SAM-dependent methyltransferase [Chitinophagales bacterium]